MTPLPKRRNSTRRASKRQRARALSRVLLVRCPNCGKAKKAHLVCPACGFYDQRLVIAPKEKRRKTGQETQ